MSYPLSRVTTTLYSLVILRRPRSHKKSIILMKQLIYMCSCCGKPRLTEPGFLSQRIRGCFLLSGRRYLSIKGTVCLVFIFLFVSVLAFAQQKITGVVTTPDGLPLSGATISINGSKTGTVTKEDGSFTVTANKDDLLFISYVGYSVRQIAIGNETNLKISLEPSFGNLDKVVVLGRSEEHTSELQSLRHLVCRLLLE